MTGAVTMGDELARARRTVFEPHTHHRTPAMSGTYINVAEPGYREGATQAPWPPRPDRSSIFVFGGSMAFGYGVADRETIPARLEAQLGAAPSAPRVYNFASINHTSSEERIRFDQLMIEGHAPKIAIFIDGFSELVGPHYRATLLAPFIEAMGKAPLHTRLRRALVPSSARSDLPVPSPAETIERYCRGMRLTIAAAKACGVQPLFVWQPAPCYRNDRFAREGADTGHAGASHILSDIQAGYEAIDARRSAFDTAHFLWLADIQRGRDEAFYVDADHYTAAFSDEVASHIAARVALWL